MQDKHPTEIIKELNFEIHTLENLVCEQMKVFEVNYLNENE
jgi:hypothetical protein